MWLREGDQSTKFFHLCANARRASNTIRSLVVGRRHVVDREGIRHVVMNHFMGSFRSSSEQPVPTHPAPPPTPLTGISPSTLVLGILYPFSPTLFSDICLPRSCALLSSFVHQVSLLEGLSIVFPGLHVHD